MSDLRFSMGRNPQIRLKTAVTELKGDKGDTGNNFTILSQYETLEDLQMAHPEGNPGDAYAVGGDKDSLVYIWDVEKLQWVCIGGIWSDSRIESIYNKMVQLVNSMGGTWISFTDTEGNPTTEPFIHWQTEDDGTPITTPAIDIGGASGNVTITDDDNGNVVLTI